MADSLLVVNVMLNGAALIFLLRLEHRLATLEAQAVVLMRRAGLA